MAILVRFLDNDERGMNGSLTMYLMQQSKQRRSEQPSEMQGGSFLINGSTWIK
jgi:hypothetical protein